MITLIPIDDYTRENLAALVRRLQQSKHAEELVYRESELDEVWRLIDGDRVDLVQRLGVTAQVQALERLQAAIHEAHDLVADSDDGSAAARRLSEVILEWGIAPTRAVPQRS